MKKFIELHKQFIEMSYQFVGKPKYPISDLLSNQKENVMFEFNNKQLYSISFKDRLYMPIAWIKWMYYNYFNK